MFASPAVIAVNEYTQTLNFSDWPAYVNGTNIAALPQVSRTIKRFVEDEKMTIEIRYPSGDQGRQWGESLLNWFVAFGIPTRYLELLPGSGAADQLVISLIDRR